MRNNKPFVSVICVAYNQAAFIRQTLDSFVMQKTIFPFEVIVHDDASTDGTADIIREYVAKYPDIIKPIFQKENQYSKNIPILSKHIWPKITSKYVAMCDGDDYWCDEYKLQKQVDFLESHPDYSICFHPVYVFWENASHPDSVWPSKPELHHKDLKTLMQRNFIPNCSVMYRWKVNNLDIVKEYPDDIYPCDWFVHLLHAKHGKIGFLPDIMSRYRRHSGGISFVSEYGDDAVHMKYGVKEMNFFIATEKQIAPEPASYHPTVCSKARQIIESYAKHKNINGAISVLKKCPDLMQGCCDCKDILHLKKYLYVSMAVIVVLGVLLLAQGC